jgi:hypothetical protein
MSSLLARREVVRLLVELVEPKRGNEHMRSYMWFWWYAYWIRKHLERSGGNSGITRHNDRCENDGFVYYGWRKGISNNKS